MAVLLASLMLASSGAGGSAQDHTAEYEKVRKTVEQIRGLTFKRNVEEVLLTREQYRRKLQEHEGGAPSPEEVVAHGRVLVALGLAPEGVDLLGSEEDFTAEVVDGFYEPQTEKLYLIDAGKELGPLDESIYAHELIHALQDQHFDLGAMNERVQGKNDDEAMAVASLIEGDATAVEVQYAGSEPGLEAQIEREREQSAPEEDLLEDLIPLDVESSYFPYEAGEAFVTALQEEGGHEAVNRAFRDPPKSTEQIIHPQKYLGERDEPTLVDLPDLSTILGPGWEKLDENTLGEFQIGVLLAGLEPTERSVDAARSQAEGWDGDRYALYARRDGEVVVWQSVWDSEEEAGEFAAALWEYDENRFAARYQDSGGTLMLNVNGRVALIERNGARVSYVLATTADIATKVLGAATGKPRVVPDETAESGATETSSWSTAVGIGLIGLLSVLGLYALRRRPMLVLKVSASVLGVLLLGLLGLVLLGQAASVLGDLHLEELLQER